MQRLSVAEYFRRPESLRPMELVWGVVREPPAPRYVHQSVVTRLTALLDAHVRARSLGEVCVAPVDVVLDRYAGLVLQPDVVFVTSERRQIIRESIWGSPDLVVEVLSPRTASRDRTTKLRWYRKYGVRECWLVDPVAKAIEVRPLTRGARHRSFSGSRPMQSTVLTEWDVPAGAVFS